MLRSIPIQHQRQHSCPFDPAVELHRLRTEDPVSRQPAPNGDSLWLVTRDADVRRVLRDKSFSNALTPKTLTRPLATGKAAAAGPARQPGAFLGCDPPEHTRLRAMVGGQFAAKQTRLFQPHVERTITACLDSMEQSTRPVDLVQEFALRIPSTLACEMFGVPEADRADFRRHAENAFDLTLTREQLLETVTWMWDYLARLVANQRREPEDNLLGTLVREHGAELTDDELTGMTNMLLAAGHDTLSAMLSLGVLLLLRHPEQLATVRDGSGSIDSTVEELLRYLSVVPTGLVRTAVEDVSLGGRRIKAGDYVMNSLPSANRDGGRYPDPDRFDVTREATGHVAFGAGIHYCLGAPLARMVLRSAYPALFRRFPGLRLAIPFDEVQFRTVAAVYGVKSLPMTW